MHGPMSYTVGPHASLFFIILQMLSIGSIAGYKTFNRLFSMKA